MKTKRPGTPKTSRGSRGAATKRTAATKPKAPRTTPAAKKATATKPKSAAAKTKTSAAKAKTARPKPPPRAEAKREPIVAQEIREFEAELDRLLDERTHRPHVEAPAEEPTAEEPAAEEDPPAQPEGGPDSSFAVTADAAPEPARLEPDLEAELEMTRAYNAALPDLGSRADLDPEGIAATRVMSGRDLFPEPPPVPVPMAPTGDEPTVFDTTRELLSSDFYLRKWGRLAMRGRSEEVDDFGFDPVYDAKARSVLEFLYTRYFRVTTSGIERVPAEGRCLLVANHSGTLPLDGVMLKAALKLEHPSGRDLRWLTEDFIHHMPYLGSMLNRLGAVRACQENAERLLAKDELCAVFPEGLKGIAKLFSERYRLQRFGRGGFIKLCLRTKTPIIPVAIVGAEETNPLLFKIEYLSRALGLPYVPVTPTFPALGPLGLLPAPTKWQIHFGEPLDFGSYGRDAADDDLLVGKLADRVRATIQGMLDRAVASRKSVFFG